MRFIAPTGYDSRAPRAYGDSSNDRTRVSARPLWRCGVCYESLAARAFVPFLQAKRKRVARICRARCGMDRGADRVSESTRLNLACVVFNTHWGPARRVVYSVLSSRSRLGFVLLSPPFCDRQPGFYSSPGRGRIHITAGGTLCAGPKRRRASRRFSF